MSGALCLMAGALGTRSSGSSGNLTASASGGYFYGVIATAGTATTGTCSITASSTSGPITYAWTRVSGDATSPVSNATAASVTWSHVFGAAESLISSWQCAVSDGVSTVILSPIAVELERT